MDSAPSPGLLLFPVPAVRRRFRLPFLRLFFCGAVGTESRGVRYGGEPAPLELHNDFRVRRLSLEHLVPRGDGVGCAEISGVLGVFVSS